MSTAKVDLTIDTSQLVDGPAQIANASDVTTPLTNLRDHLRDGLVAVSTNDTHVKTLNEALTVAGSGISKAIQNASADENLQLTLHAKLEALLALLATGGLVPAAAMDSTGASSGEVLTANGSGGASWAAAGGGGAQPIDLTITAGEDLAERDMVFLNEADGEWYKMDIDASPVLCGALRGCVNESGGITNNSTGTVRILGEVDGFTSLTAWGRVWASSTAGSYTQTKPNPSLGGGQLAVAEMGYATSTTAIFIQPRPVQYMKAETMADDDTLTIEHHADVQGRERDVRVYLASETAGAVATEYASSNYDSDKIKLQGPTDGSGDSISISATGVNAALGDVAGAEYGAAQSFTTVNGGILSQFTADFNANNGSPSGICTWTLETDNSNSPSGTVLATNTFTPTPSATNTINVTDGPALAASTKYWLTMKVPAQATNARYHINFQNSSVYAGGSYFYTTDGGASWIAQNSGNADLDMTFTLSATSGGQKLTQIFQIASGADIANATLYLRKYGSPTGTLTARIETVSGGNPTGTLVDVNATATYSEASLTTSFAQVTFNFAGVFSLSATTDYALVLQTDRSQSDTNYVAWGADISSPSYSAGSGKSYNGSSWDAESVDFIFAIYENGIQYDSRALVDDWDTALAVFGNRFDDGSGSDGDTMTTIKNYTGVSKDVITIVELR